MKWSWRIGRVAGITVYLHATLLILLVWVAHSYYAWRHRPGDVADAVLFIAAFFGIVLLHELGHALTARHFGIRTRDITIMPIGGLARMERMPTDPRQELKIAVAGPAVNVLLALVYFGALSPVSALVHPRELQPVGGHFLSSLVWANIAMAAFNLVPAFPMDGGRVLRSLLALRLSHKRATRIAVDVGQALAFAFGAIGLYTMNPILVFIALFVYLGADDEAELAEARSVLEGVPIRNVMITNFRSLAPDDTLQRAVEETLAGFHLDFPVVDGHRVVGILTRRDLLSALAQRSRATPVGDLMQTQFRTANPDEDAQDVFSRLEECECHSLPVVKEGRVLGMLTAENVHEFLRLQAALAPKRQAKAGTGPMPPRSGAAGRLSC